MNRHGVRVIGHAGDTQLFHSLLFLVPEHDAGVFVSYNSPGGIDAREEFIDEFVEQYFPTEEPSVTVSDSTLTRGTDLEGTYRTLRVPSTTSEKFIGATETVSVSRRSRTADNDARQRNETMDRSGTALLPRSRRSRPTRIW